MTSTNDIRRGFLDFFERERPRAVPSAPLVPHNDPTLMFVNAGMVPFKNVFTGLETRPYSTATSSQKCVRAGGKHNDLDNVGYTARHHTFFEMLGNFSFGDYFKDRAIELAWNLLTKEWGLQARPADRDRLSHRRRSVRPVEKDRRPARKPHHPHSRPRTISGRWARTGHAVRAPRSSTTMATISRAGRRAAADEDGDRFVEIWNLVFMQYEQANDEIVAELPSKSIDTGMGLERVAAVLQGVTDNYDTDTFKALIHASEELTRTSAEGEQQASHRVIADHLRASGFLVADGILPANEGRGYVLRRIMRRAMRHAHILGVEGSADVPAGAGAGRGNGRGLSRAGARAAADRGDACCRRKRASAGRSTNGLRLLDEATGEMGEGGTLAGETAFKLYDTFGFPYDLTEDALRARGMNVDRAGFDSAMAEQKRQARAAWKGSGEKASDDLWFDLAEEHGATEFIGYAGDEGEGVVLALIKDGAAVDGAVEGETVQVLLNQTPFYGESGGQIGDHGKLSSLKGFEGAVEDTSKPLGKLHALTTKVVEGQDLGRRHGSAEGRQRTPRPGSRQP